MEEPNLSPKAKRRAQRREERTRKQMARTPKPLSPKNEAQKFLIDCLFDSPQVFAIGGAGTGKTYIASRLAIRKLLDGDTTRVVVCRPTVSKHKHRQGFLPGGVFAKLRPWLIPIIEAMREECGMGHLDKLIQEGHVEFLAFEHMRGRSIPDAVVILDEAQNCDIGDLKLFLTRIGENSQVVVCGDTDQVDIEDSGLTEILDMIDRYDMTASVVEFSPEDVVRSATAREWVKAFDKEKDR